MRRKRGCVAIDGPVAAGKSTIARLVARELGYTYIDSGAMYRALAWAACRDGISGEDSGPVLELLRKTDIDLRPRPDGSNAVLVDGEEITGEIRTPEIGQLASRLSAVPAVRRRMVSRQQAMGRGGGVVMEGRDIQTVVLPDAEVKVFLTASVGERARRRWEELQQRGLPADLGEVAAEIEARDRRDTTRADSPLTAAPDAVQLDTDGLSIEQVAERVLEIARARLAGG